MSKLYKPSNAIEKIEWIHITKNEIKYINEMGVYGDFKQTLFPTNGFYASSYCCPECARMPLYKIQVHGLKTKFYDSTAVLYNVFTCPICRRFFATVLNSELEGNMTREDASRLPNFGIYSNRYDFETYHYLLELLENAYYNYPNRTMVLGNNLYNI